MPHGREPSEYFHNDWVDKPIEQIWSDIESFSNEIFADEPEMFWNVAVSIILPPLALRGRRLKGLLMTQAVDLLLERLPRLADHFVLMAYSMGASLPWSRSADAYLVYYDNPQRLKWFKEKHADPVRAAKVFIPLADADYTNETVLRAVPGAQRVLDVLIVSTSLPKKNLPLVAKALQIYEQKHGPINANFVLGVVDRSKLRRKQAEQLAQVEALMQTLKGDVEIVEYVDHNILNQFYSRAKLAVLGSLFEGANRSLKEAALCDTPVVCFRAYNQYVRGTTEIVLPGTGLYAPNFNAESLADTIYEALLQRSEFKPREMQLKVYGRKNFLNACLHSIPYFRDQLIPDTGADYSSDRWLIEALQERHRVTLDDWLYETHEFSGDIGLDKNLRLLERLIDG